ncbi:MAG TPA: UDP-N-acetylglucosamine 1-carboxyvinyltransferase [Bacillota bacterium]
MDRIVVTGGTRLEGRVTAAGAKNSVLPMIAAALLTDEQVNLFDIPPLDDVFTICEVLQRLGVDVRIHQPGLVTISAKDLEAHEAPYDLVRKMRASVLVMGPLLARLGRVKLSLPGGCAIGTRPIDLHLKGLRALGAVIETEHGTIEARVRRLRGNRIYLDYPSVGATENLIMAATLAEGVTIIENAAEEPEIGDLITLLDAMGARIQGSGSKVIRIEGVDRLHTASHRAIPDRIEAGTYMVAAAMTGGDVYVGNAVTEHLEPVIAKLAECGALVIEDNGGIRVVGPDRPRPVDVKTMPYPGFPTDMQPQMMALLTIAGGTSVITETVFENRYMHVAEFKRMGADIVIDGRTAIVKGVPGLSGAPVRVPDLRAGAALIVAGLAAEGETEVWGINHVDRGYVNIEGKLRSLGAVVARLDEAFLALRSS